MRRQHRVELQLSDAELAEVDAQRGSVVRAAWIRSLIMRRPREASDVADREEALALLTAQARAGKVAASIALERALRDDRQPQTDDGWLERLVNGR